jgi:bla regulator protein blaR1
MKARIAVAIAAGMAMQAALAADVLHCTELVDAASGKLLVREGQCDRRMPPMSTFKIAISLMGYDSGVLVDEHAPNLPFKEGYVDWRPEWRMPTDPTAWLQKSVVWYSQQVTAMIGEDRYKNYVKRFNYGNQDVSGEPGKHDGLAYAWLNSSLQISPDEQAFFLRNLVNRKLGVSAKAYDMTARLLRLKPLENGWDIYGKTGAGSPRLPDGSSDSAHAFGWFAGWATKGQRTVVFVRLGQDEQEQPGSAGWRVRDALLRDLPALLDPP